TRGSRSACCTNRTLRTLWAGCTGCACRTRGSSSTRRACSTRGSGFTSDAHRALIPSCTRRTLCTSRTCSASRTLWASRTGRAGRAYRSRCPDRSIVSTLADQDLTGCTWVAGKIKLIAIDVQDATIHIQALAGHVDGAGYANDIIVIDMDLFGID